jgi:hypothetical protein
MKSRLLAVCATICLLAPPIAAQSNNTLQADGLTQPVEIIRDR